MKKFLSSVLVFIIALLSVSITSNANSVTSTDNARVTVTCSPSTITVGSEFDIIFSVTKLGNFSKLYGASGTLSYNSTYLSYVGMSPKGNWSTPTYNANTGKLSILSNDGEDAGEVLAFRFKLLAKPATTVTVFQFSDISITDNEDELEFTHPLSITLNVKDSDTTNNTTTNTTTNTTGNTTPTNNTSTNTTTNTIGNTTTNNTIGNDTTNNTVDNNTIDNNTIGNNTVDNNTINNSNIVINTQDNNNNSNSGTITVVDNSTTNKQIPYTGFNTFIIVAIGASLGSGIYAYYRYRRLNI